MLKNKLKVFCLYDKGGCHWWRLWNPLTHAVKQGLLDVRFTELKVTRKEEMGADLAWCDVVFALGIMDLNWIPILRQWKSLGLRVVVDYDDLHFNVSPWNTAYRTFGMENVEVRDPKTGDKKFLWKDGVDGFDIRANKLKFYCYQQVLKDIDLATTTTVYLKDAMQEVSPGLDIRVLPNSIDFSLWKPMPQVREKFSDKFRFGWAVSGSHGEDWLAARPFLLEFLKRHKDAKFVCIGDTYFDIRQGMIEVKEQIEWYPFSNLWEMHYPMRMAMLGLDVAIAPLAETEFNKCKSPLKFAEYTAFGWPTIAQKMLPYSECIVSGENGLLADTSDSFTNALQSLYDSPSLRAKLHFNALATTKKFFDVTEVCKDYAATLSELKDGTIPSLR